MDLRSCVFRVIDEQGQTRGTGFVVSPTLAVTCAHVAEACGVGPGQQVHLVFDADDTAAEGEVLADGWHPEADVAFLRLADALPHSIRPTVLGPSADANGHTFRALGYPQLGGFWGIWTEGQILGPVKSARGTMLLQLRSQEVTLGMSGAPVYDVNAHRVVGMITSTYLPDTTLKLRDAAFAVPSEVLAELCPEPLALRPPERLVRLPPLSVHPRTERFQHDHPLISRDTDLEWLRQLGGDGLLVGQPGSGKTFLLHKFALEGGGLFVVKEDATEIAESIAAEHPRAVIVDDAQIRQELLVDLKHIRDELGLPFSVLASCWPGDQEAVAQVLHVAGSNVRSLGLLTRDEIVEVIRATGLGGPSALVRELVNQAEGRPGLAATLTHICLQGEVRGVAFGDVLSSSFLRFFEPLIGRMASVILAALSIGGDAGMPMQAVAYELDLDPHETREAVTKLAAGGVILEIDRKYLSVRPPALRHVLLRDVFFGGATSLPIEQFQRLAERAHNKLDAVLTLIGARARGAVVPHEILINYLERMGSLDAWREYAHLGRDEAIWVLTNYPGLLIPTARSALYRAPDVVIPLLLEKAVGDQRQLHSTTEHPLRMIGDWVSAGYPGTGEAIRRRELLLDLILAWLSEGGDTAVALRAFGCVLSPAFRDLDVDPGTGRSATLREGYLLMDELGVVQGFWDKVLETIRGIEIADWKSVRDMVESWAYPGRSSVHIPDEMYEAIRAFGGQILRDIVSLATAHPGICHWAERVAEHLGLDVEIPLDPSFEVLYPPEGLDNWKADQARQTEAVQELAEKWSRLTPEQVAERIAAIEQEALLVDARWPRWTPFLCEEIAQRAPSPGDWTRAIVSADISSGDLVLPFLRRAAKTHEPGWEELATACLDDPALRGAGASLILTLPEPPEALLSKALAALEGLASLVETICLRNQVSEGVLKRLLCRENASIASAAAKAEWHAEPEGIVRDSVISDWRRVVVQRTTDEYWLGHVLKRDPLLAYEWLQARVNESQPELFGIAREKTIGAAVSALDIEGRRRMLRQVPATWEMSVLVAQLVGENLELYQELLGDDTRKTFHLVPLIGYPEGAWLDMARQALDAGYDPGKVAFAVHGQPGIEVEWSGSESEIWSDWVQRFEKLCSHEDRRIQQVGIAGRDQARERLARALERERKRAIYGGW